ncbi:hypothetical protein BGX31_005125 [Mortierella sp. GBA43]|nr:hypothetical protein BGX31_005125 [Mortierella sp. GBA43]
MHPHPGSTQVSPSPEPTVPTQVNVPDGVILVPEYFHLADMTHLIIMIGRSSSSPIALDASACMTRFVMTIASDMVGGLSTQELNTLEVEFLGLIEWRVAVEGSVMQRYYVNLVRQHAQFEITESVPQPLSSASHAQNDDEQMGAADPQDEGDQVVAEPDYEEGLRDQWIPMGE